MPVRNVTDFIVTPRRDDSVVITKRERTENTTVTGQRQYKKDVDLSKEEWVLSKKQVSSLLDALVREVTYVYAYGEDQS